jgi:heat shock protein HtpX
MILGSMVVAAFSRWREYRADRGGALLSSREHMIAALQALQRTYGSVDGAEQASVQTLKISSKGSGIFKLFSTHPPLEDRIARLMEQV